MRAALIYIIIIWLSSYDPISDIKWVGNIYNCRDIDRLSGLGAKPIPNCKLGAENNNILNIMGASTIVSITWGCIICVLLKKQSWNFKTN